ncbi:DoxX-like family protein [Acinetobacter sp. ANC 4805]|uniref:DoxX-like family protein n=1 Tax=Acinetobacter sp. ANC 4805 TaxID=2923425 RepID=UPI001F4AAA78|nr:DoxX-like family protein [Acinetobacter sp. ANC 4805]MCH7312708.1 DoxX-like family protein [Acinetobacter sp. ANC 4805]
MKDAIILKFINIILAVLWVYQGLIPKLIFTSPDEIAVWQWMGLSPEFAKLAGQATGIAEILFGLCFMMIYHKIMHYLSILGLLFLLILIGLLLPDTLLRAFNPVVMNLAMISLSCIFLMLSRQSDLN